MKSHYIFISVADLISKSAVGAILVELPEGILPHASLEAAVYTGIDSDGDDPKLMIPGKFYTRAELLSLGYLTTNTDKQ